MCESSPLPPLREVIAEHGLAPRKSLGQNFILDPQITAKIVRSAGDLTGTNVFEVGAGPGGLTRALMATNARSITIIECDPRCVAALRDLQDPRLTLIEGDALAMDLTLLAPPPRVLVANLPYNIATPLLTGWLHQKTAWHSMTLMFQREVAQRLTATPSTPAYGRLSVLAQWLCDVYGVMDLPPAVFTPPPKVHSRVVHFIPRILPQDAPPIEALEALTAQAFGTRRKMLRSCLKSHLPALEALGIDPTLRAENLTPLQFVALAIANARLA